MRRKSRRDNTRAPDRRQNRWNKIAVEEGHSEKSSSNSKVQYMKREQGLPSLKKHFMRFLQRRSCSTRAHGLIVVGIATPGVLGRLGEIEIYFQYILST